MELFLKAIEIVLAINIKFYFNENNIKIYNFLTTLNLELFMIFGFKIRHFHL